jgi:hypothetical protein
MRHTKRLVEKRQSARNRVAGVGRKEGRNGWMLCAVVRQGLAALLLCHVSMQSERRRGRDYRRRHGDHVCLLTTSGSQTQLDRRLQLEYLTHTHTTRGT